MDYNYIRMRNAIKDGDNELAAHYRNLYESGKDIKAVSHIIDYILILLTVIAVALGIYAVCYRQSIQSNVTSGPESEAVSSGAVETTEQSEG